MLSLINAWIDLKLKSWTVAMTSIAVVVMISYLLVALFFTPQQITLVGKIELETFDPACRDIRPPCTLPSLSAAILTTSGGTYFLTTNDSNVARHFYEFQGMVVTVRGNVRPFNMSSAYAGYKCSPYPCREIVNQLIVVSIELAGATTSPTQPSLKDALWVAMSEVRWSASHV